MIRLVHSTREVLTVSHTALIGRATECDLTLSWPDISRKHCRIDKVGDGFTVTDLNSLNGTFVNGDIMTPGAMMKIYPGDTVQVGRICFNVEQAA